MYLRENILKQVMHHSPAISPTSQVGSSYAQVIIVPTVSFTMATTSSSNSCKQHKDNQ